MIEAQKVVSFLGGKKVFPEPITSELQFFECVNEGLPIFALEKLIEAQILSPKEARQLIVSLRTFARRKKATRLNPQESDRLARVARIISYAEEVMGDREKAHIWLRSPNRALHGHIPIDLLGSDSGARLVETILGRIEHGIYS